MGAHRYARAPHARRPPLPSKRQETSGKVFQEHNGDQNAPPGAMGRGPAEAWARPPPAKAAGRTPSRGLNSGRALKAAEMAQLVRGAVAA